MNKLYRKLLLLLSLIIIIGYYILPQESPLPLLLPLKSPLIQQPDYVITDIDLIKCYHKCSIPPNYQQIYPNIDSVAKSKVISYNIIIKSEPLDQAQEVIVDVSTEPIDESYQQIANFNKYKLYKKSIPISDNVNEPPQIRSIEVLFGNNEFQDPRPQHQTIHLPGDTLLHPILSLNKSPSTLPSQQYNEIIQHSRDKYKIMQLSDLHIGQTDRQCHNSKCFADSKTINFVDDAIQAEKPDMVVLTGDIFDIDRTRDYKSVLIKALSPILKHSLPFLYIFGDELNRIPDGPERQEVKTSILEYLSTLPGCLNDQIAENGKFLPYMDLEVRYKSESILITSLDSENLNDGHMSHIYRKARMDDDDDNDSKKQYDYKLLFFHHPLGEFRPVGKFKLVGSYNEKHPLGTATGMVRDMINCGYAAVGVGHEHENDACILYPEDDGKEERENKKSQKKKKAKKIWLCYSGVTGDSGITKLNRDYDRRMRMFEVDFELKRILSWKRTESDRKAFDYQQVYPL
ncbi:SIA1 [[Candida] subhashii]|uniref:SIA1 n=1 Tax=[Candida] subhashii TaxID=561895 RepID=A0A8J5V196_9ASCO|nr:SIA1 [[Candida] subhashii]KAG7665870.1 SIA1 [[Candida] subhashii]